ncbi:GNAT family N-acetyltransferase [Flavobacterium silvaticum]|uniref:GNAT family N-acetyltransferase n=1 Tax=Flavobacterium silvaticum TaxID=1852020 RepID=A0A972FLU3_9FLAO|nr:GNAT family N-acetyltransferase [Flavobacterium silvaticum]NMH28434.1 GNAT family N-acetyltransferase [Flavobacterium silvaticum]
MTEPIWKIRRFEQLSSLELYQLLQLRSEVFVVEQDCVYQDIDGKDAKAMHVTGEYDGKIVAYSRIFKPWDYFEQASIGRVVIDANYRDRKWGHELLRQSIKGIETFFGENNIHISAQCYLQKFYESHGFVGVGETYMEDGIPHLGMDLN